MRFFAPAFVAVSALASAVFAGENPIIKPTSDSAITAGSPFTITWTPTTSGQVTLKLRQGPSTNLKDVAVLTTTDNSGSYSWTPSSDLVAGSDYAIEIIDASGDVNYTPLFSIASNVKSSASSAAASSTSSAAASSSAAATSAAATSAVASSAAAVSSVVVESASVQYTVTQSWVTATMTHCPSGCSAPIATGTGVPTYSNSTTNGTVAASTQTPKATSLTTGSSATASSSSLPVATGGASALARSPIALVAGLIGAAMFL